MTYRHFSGCVALCLTVAIGCGGAKTGPKLAPPVKVKGLIALDNQPISNAMVYFVPDEGKGMGNGATGITDDSGVYELVTMDGKKPLSGAIPGNYRVWISRLVKPDGTVVTPKSDVPPANMGAVESLPPRFSVLAMSELKASVSQQGGTIDFSISSR